MEPNLVGSIYIWSFIKFTHFVLIHQQTWQSQAILVSDWLDMDKFFSSETTWPNELIFYREHQYKVLKVFSFCPDPSTNMDAMGNSCFWLVNIEKIFSCETAKPNELIFDRKQLWAVLYKNVLISFHSINKHVCLRQNLFPIGWYRKIFSSEMA